LNEHVALTSLEADALVRILEDAVQVHRRHQFFVWTQSQFQTLVQHKVLICGSYHRQRRVIVCESFNSVVMSAPLQGVLTDFDSELMRRAVALWVEGGGRAVALHRSNFCGLAGDQANRLADELACDHLLLHGVTRPQRLDEIESLFVFVSEGGATGPRCEQRLEMLLPHVHSTWRHVQSVERSLHTPLAPSTHASVRGPGAERHVVTERERQILLWMREGKSNPQIGELLSISPLTVKNHVQKILRKLNSANRAQAVAQAMAQNLLLLDDARSRAQ
jgi:transcriptional regulator EpsA